MYEIPAVYCKITEQIYVGAFFQVKCGNNLSKKIYMTRGTKTGNPLRVIIFLLVIERSSLLSIMPRELLILKTKRISIPFQSRHM